ncbi:DUF3224 domain-containing protein [Pseudonocardia abyssalis]|uniref:DUF3224 domain-containing protein n=1 Tax=Pseudonocardia abyssalis TaxID=2792008 RepID=A0ABS6UWS2_9PSEU|nr:DUF3224 domain-containing protein [Pseudonocardia abyssalis]MBW0115486.1 DUF3224 domain-containing protein [Pseudonocardia abyssalis]MBW0136718.1 DUF3224 domain-containing protein [Pseudonocardia abyssalis]
MTTTSGRFDLTSWDEEVYDDAEGAKLLRVANTKLFEGGIAGTSTTQLLQAFADGSAAYVGIERVTATIDGRAGAFVLRHSAVGNATGGSASIDVVPGSATGALRGLSGQMAIARSPEGDHSYTFDYELG